MKRITYFLPGALATLLISSATVSAFAASGLITLNVQPAQVMVNGTAFAQSSCTFSNFDPASVWIK